MLAEQSVAYKVIQVRAETADASTFVLAPQGIAIDYKAGQFITFLFNSRLGNEERRSYSISSAPGVDEELRITVKKVDNGTYSRWMLSHLRPGDILQGLLPAGLFIPQEEEVVTNHCFFAAGSGITPVYSMIRYLLHQKKQGLRIQLVYSNSSEIDAIFYKELQALAEQFPDTFKVIFFFSNASHYSKARLSAAMVGDIAAAYPMKLNVQFYLCGPFEYMRMISLVLKGVGVSDKQIRREQFVIYPTLPKQLPPDTAPHQVFFQGPDVSVEVQYPTTILMAARKQGIALPYSCESGQCGTCLATCVEGKVWMWRNEVLTEEEIEKGRVLTCTGFPVGGDIVLRY